MNICLCDVTVNRKEILKIHNFVYAGRFRGDGKQVEAARKQISNVVLIKR